MSIDDLANFVTARELASALGLPRRVIDDFLYEGVISKDVCPVILGRRLFPRALIPVVGAEVKRRKNRVRSRKDSNISSLSSLSPSIPPTSSAA